jgi:hypothetical protein
VPPTREQLIAAGKKAMAANDIEAANEIADMLDAMGGEVATPAQTQPRNTREGFEVVERFPGNVFLMREPDGAQSLVTPGFATSDPKDINAILRPYRKAEEYRNRIGTLEERKKAMTRQPVPGEVERRRRGKVLDPVDLQTESLEKKALEQERIFERLVSGDVEKVLGRDLSRKKPVSMLAIQALKSIPVIGPKVVGAITDVAAASTPGGEAMAQMGMQPKDITAAAMEETERTMPVSSGVANVAGAVASTAAVPGLLPLLTARGATTGAQMASGVFRGTTAAAIEGAGTAALEAPEGQRLGAAVEGGVRAAPFGALGIIPPGGAELFANARNHIARIDDGQLARELGVSRGTAAEVRTAMASEDFLAAAQALRRAGADSMLADASPVLRDYLDAAIQLGGAQARREGRQLVEARTSVASREFQQYMDDTLGVPEGRNVIGARIRLATADERNDAYNAAYGLPIDYSSESGRRIESLLRRVSGFSPGSIAQANRLLAADDETSQQILANIAADGSITFRQLPDVRQIDYIRRALGDIVESQEGRGKTGGLTSTGRAAQNLSRELRDAVAESVPEYRDALRIAASTIEEVNAARAGANALSNRMTLEDAREAFEGMTEPERVAAQLGLRNAIEEQLSQVNRIASDPNREARELREARGKLSSRLFESKLRLILGQGEAARFIANLEEASAAIELRAAINTGSKTQPRSVIQGRIEARTAPGIIGNIGRFEPAEATKLLVRGMTGQTDDAILARQSGMYDEIAVLLTNRRGRQAEDALRIIQRAIEGREMSDAQARIVARAVLQPAALVGATAGIQEYRYNPETDDFE